MTITLPWPALLEPIVQITIPGKPISQGNPQAFTNGGMAYPKSTAAHRNRVIGLLVECWGDQQPMSGPMRVMVRFGFERPKSHYWPANSRRAVRELRDDAAHDHLQTPDLDKLVRLLFDAMTIAHVLTDDCVVTKLVADKIWDSSDYTELWVYREGAA